MIVSAVQHINVVTPDLDATLAFYVDVLGLVDGPRPPFAVKGHWLYAGDRPIVHLQLAAKPVGPSTDSALNHIAFQVQDIDAAIARLEAHGVPFRVSGIPGDAARQAFFQDPNGVRLELNPT